MITQYFQFQATIPILVLILLRGISWDTNNNVYSINSEIASNTYVNIVFNLDFLNGKISMYKDGEFIGETTISRTYNRDGKDVKEFSKIKNYKDESAFFLGCGDPYRNEDGNWFKGIIKEFAIYDGLLTSSEIKAISENKMYPLTENFKQYKSSEKLLCYYDTSITRNRVLIDLSGNGNDASTHQTHLVEMDISDDTEVYVPKRRKSLIKLLSHKENGYDFGKWRSKSTRQNQIRFFNNISRKLTNIELDGLSTCKYKLLNEATVKNYHFLSVLL
jgi:hypothetical protein